MTDIEFRIPTHQPALQTAVTEFMQAEFGAAATFAAEWAEPQVDKAVDVLGIAWQVLVVAATLEGSMQLAERLARLQRVKKLLAAIQACGTSVYMKIGKQQVDLSNQSADETLDLLEQANDKTSDRANGKASEQDKNNT